MKSIKEFIAHTNAKFKGKLGRAFFATMISVLPFFAIIFAAAWLSQLVSWLFVSIVLIAIVLFGCMQVGHIRYIRALSESNETPNLKLLFSGFTTHKVIFYIFLGVIILLIYLISACLLVVPLFIAIGAFSMVFYFAEHHDYDNFLDALSMTSKRMVKHQGDMFAYKVLFYIAYLLLLAVFTIVIVWLLTIEATAVAIIAIILAHILLFVGFSFVTTLFSFCNFTFFNDVLDYHERKSRKVVMPEIKDEKKAEEDEKIAKVSAPKTTPKATTTKSTAKATTTKKTTTKKVNKEDNK